MGKNSSKERKKIDDTEIKIDENKSKNYENVINEQVYDEIKLEESKSELKTNNDGVIDNVKTIVTVEKYDNKKIDQQKIIDTIENQVIDNRENKIIDNNEVIYGKVRKNINIYENDPIDEMIKNVNRIKKINDENKIDECSNNENKIADYEIEEQKIDENKFKGQKIDGRIIKEQKIDDNKLKGQKMYGNLIKEQKIDDNKLEGLKIDENYKNERIYDEVYDESLNHDYENDIRVKEIQIENEILNNLDELLKYIAETTENLGKIDASTETEIKEKKRKKKSKKLRWKSNESEDVNIIESVSGDNRVEIDDNIDETYEVENLRWSLFDKFFIEFDEYNNPIGYEKLEFGTIKEIKSSKKGDEEKPLGPLAVFSFLEVGVEPSQINTKTPTGSSILSTGTFLRTKEHGVSYPLVHMKEDDGSFTGYLNNGHKLDNNVIQQGLYREVRSICPEEELKDINEEVRNNVAYIILGFKSLDTNFSQVMIDSWKDWTGARYIYMYLPDELGLTRIRFYRRELPNGSSIMFTYLVIVECRNVNSKEKHMKLLEFARRLRVQKINSYISVYGITENGFNGISPNHTTYL